MAQAEPEPQLRASLGQSQPSELPLVRLGTKQTEEVRAPVRGQASTLVNMHPVNLVVRINNCSPAKLLSELRWWRTGRALRSETSRGI